MDLRIFTEPQQGASFDQLLAVAQAAESCRFDGFFRSDHYLVMGPGAGLPGPTDAWATLAAIARETSRIRLGTLVSPVGFRWPGPLAVAVAQVDIMSNGRVELGLGAGWYESEYHAYGIPFPPLAERFEQLEEQLSILTGMWRTPLGMSFDFLGRHYRLTGCPALPKPVQRPHPPLIVGGAGTTRTPRLAARFADEFNVAFRDLDTASALFDGVRTACEEADRDPATLTLSVALTVCCGVDDAEIEHRARAIGRPPERIDLAGTPEQLADRLLAFRAAGAQRVYLQILDLADLDHLQLIADEVAPHLA
ncbi:MAG TPA: LLM class F420-dependent oxidoreductase [Acidimicrobiales bacterium]|nr:LLM class F420-dependent oxidoreductase [Acidimicrobiales bacterium]